MQPATSQPTAGARPDGGLWLGARTGLAPLGLLAVAVALTVALTALARILSFSLGFLVWQWIVVGVWIAGLVISAGVYAYAAYRALRRATAWQRAGLSAPASAAYWTLAITALIVLLPTLIALALPQTPAP